MRLTEMEKMLLAIPSCATRELIAKRDAAAEGYTTMTDDERREYMRLRKAESRQRQREAKRQGEPLPTKDSIRDALADAALMLLAVDGPGAEEIRNVLSRVFSSKPGLVLRVSADARKGKLRPRLLKA
jgi:hypothetical protein